MNNQIPAQPNENQTTPPTDHAPLELPASFLYNLRNPDQCGCLPEFADATTDHAQAGHITYNENTGQRCNPSPLRR